MANGQALSGLTAVVTGSASGIGRATARELAAAGASVIVHTRQSREAAELTATQVAEHTAAKVVLCDLADTAEHARFVEQCWTWQNGVDIWINNAGVDVLTGTAASWTFEEKLAALWAVDVVATMRLSRLIGRKMQQRRHGVIITTGWDQAEQGMAGDSGELFAAIKGAVMAFTKSLAQSLAPDVRVNCIAPGWIRTAWGDQASAAWQQRACEESLLARWGVPNDVAAVTRFLVSPEAGFITGQIVHVNGGFRTSR